MRLDEVAGRVAPEGPVMKSTSWTALLSWSVNVIVVPAATVSVEGEKLRALLFPTPDGIMIDAVNPEPEVEEVLEVEAVVMAMLVDLTGSGIPFGYSISTAPSATGMITAMITTSTITVLAGRVMG